MKSCAAPAALSAIATPTWAKGPISAMAVPAKTTRLIALATTGVFAGTALALMGPFAHVGVAMALSAAGAAQLFMLLGLLRRKVGRLGLRAVAQSALKVSVASAAMAGASLGVARFGTWEAGAGLVNALILIGAVVAGGVVFVAVAKALRAGELDEVLGALRRRVKR